MIPRVASSKLHKHERTYEMLEELNTKPRTRYMARIRATRRSQPQQVVMHTLMDETDRR